YLSSRLILPQKIADPNLKVNWNFFATSWEIARFSYGLPLIFLILMGNSWYWFYGATVITQIPQMTQQYLHGVVIGSFICKKFSGEKLSLKMVPYGAIGLTIFAFYLSWALGNIPAQSGDYYNIAQALRSLVPGATSAHRANPAEEKPSRLSITEARHVAGLMRVNHSGEVCAQALYHGQAMTAKLPSVRQEMEHAAEEEQDHLAWCEDRLQELSSYPSLLNPVWYTLSFAMGAIAGIAGDQYSLGFVAETEKQVSAHLLDHLSQLPAQDDRSRAIL
ncbi:hypothetical protein GWI33_000955, partial [Rhynchophorus ferrugineus]